MVVLLVGGVPMEGGNGNQAFLLANDETEEELLIAVGTTAADVDTGIIPKPLL